jgi:hypothetical protein
MTTKTNPDYSASAVNLTNPPEVLAIVISQSIRRKRLDNLREEANDCVPVELRESIIKLEDEIAAEDKSLRGYIDTFGSYQDVESGYYAVKQRRESIIYRPELVNRFLPAKFAQLVIVESVDTRALDGLVKGNLVTQEQAKQCGEVKESFAYVIK